MKLLDLFETHLMELRGYTAPNVDVADSFVIAWRGYFWILPTSDDEEVPSESLYSIAQTLGMDEFEEGDNYEYFRTLLGDFDDTRPDVIQGYIHNNILHVTSTQHTGYQSPVTSGMIKKLVYQLKLAGAGTNHPNWYGDDDPDYTNKVDMVGALPKTLFHGTTSAYMMSIARTGINPGKSPSNWKHVHIEHPDLIFGATTLVGATFHANKTAGIQFDSDDQNREPDDPFPVILEFIIPDPSRIVPDYDVASSVIGHTDQADALGYTNMTNYGAFSHADEITDRNPEGRLWKSASVFGYMGRIPASHITRVYTNFFSENPLDGDYEWSGSLQEFFEEYDDRYQAYFGYEDDEDED